MNIVSRRLMTSALAVTTLCASAALPDPGVERGPQRRATASALAAAEARVIVKLKADSALVRALSANAGSVRPLHAQALGSRLGVTLSDGRALGARTQVLKGQGLTSRELADRLSSQPDVEYASVDERKYALAAPNDPLYAGGQTGTNVPPSGQWYLRAPTSSVIANSTSIVAAINAEAAWDITKGRSGVVVAVLDTGVRRDHPDLTSKLLPGYDFINSTTVSNDGDGRDTDPSDPGDVGCGETASSWHGTQTSGLIGAATNNGIGMAGVGRNVMLLPARVLGCGGGFDSDIQAAMLWSAGIAVPGVPANTTPAKVLNMSLGAAGACAQTYKDTIAQVVAAGVAVVVAAGNEGLDVGTPANCPGAIAVAGVRQAGTKVGYSDLGPSIAVAAPAGNCVNSSGPCLFPLLTTSNSGATTPVVGDAGATYTGTGDDASLGTSFSAPLVAGAVALMYSADPSITPVQVLAALKATARPFPAVGFDPNVKTCTAPTTTAQNVECYCTTSTCGAGLLDVGAAVARVAVLNPSIAAAPSSATVGATVPYDGTGSNAAAGRNIVTYQWALGGDSGAAQLTADSTSGLASVSAVAAGNITLSLTVTDNAGNSATSAAVPLTIAPVPVASSGGGGGGGAMQLGWLLGWLASVIGVWCVTPRRRNAD